MNNYLKIGLLIICSLCQYQKIFAQGKGIAYPGMLEVKHAVVDNQKIYLLGCVPHIETLTSNPVIVCTNLSGDTLWTREFDRFEFGASFEKAVLADHILYISGTIKETKYSSESVLFQVSDTGEMIGGRFFRGKIIADIAWNGVLLFLTGIAIPSNESYLLQCDPDFKNDTLISFWKEASGNSYGNGREIQFLKSSLWLSGTYETDTRDGYTVTRFDKNLKELPSFTLKKDGDSRCLKMIADKSNSVWTCGHLNPESGTHFLYVLRFNEKGDTIYSYKHFMGTRSFLVTNLFETASGEILAVTKINHVAQLIRFRQGKFYKIESLESLGDILPVQLMEPKSGQIMLLAMELLGMGYGKSTFFSLKLTD